MAAPVNVERKDHDGEVTASDIEEEESRIGKRTHDPDKPTSKELE